MNKKENVLTTVFPQWKSSIKERRYENKNGDVVTRYYIHIGRELQRQVGTASDYFSAASMEELVEKLYEAFSNATADDGVTLTKVFNQYLDFRKDIGTNSKTIREDFYTWNRHFRNTQIANINVSEITPIDIKNHFLKITADYKITKTCFKNAKGLLKGILDFCLDETLISSNPIEQVSYKQFAKRFKPTNPNHDDYTREEIAALIQYFRKNESARNFTIYDYAVWFALNACMRIGEIKALKFSDFKDGVYTIDKSIVSRQDFSINESGKVQWGKIDYVETAPKGNASSGFRFLPITDDIAHIVSVMKEANPQNEYLFMCNGHQLGTAVFNRHLKKACDELSIPYRSSHTIRFSNSDGMFYGGGIDIRDMQSFMGHSSVNMTIHYFNRHCASQNGMDIAREYLSVPKAIG